MAKDYLIGELLDETEDPSGEIPSLQESDSPTGTWWNVLASPTWSNLLIPVGISIVVYVSYTLAHRFIF
jgi:hypothetical protein